MPDLEDIQHRLDLVQDFLRLIKEGLNADVVEDGGLFLPIGIQQHALPFFGHRQVLGRWEFHPVKLWRAQDHELRLPRLHLSPAIIILAKLAINLQILILDAVIFHRDEIRMVHPR